MVAVFAGLQQGTNSYIIAADGDRGTDQRDSLADDRGQARRAVVLPSMDDLAKSGIDAAKLAKATPASLAGVVDGKSSEAMLIGQLAWNDRKLGWDAQWRMDFGGKDPSLAAARADL